MQRFIAHQIAGELTNHKVIFIIGQRQVGKTTQLQALSHNPGAIYIDFEDMHYRSLIETASVDVLERVFGDKQQPRLLLLDEIQYLPHAGSVLKLLHDHFPHTKVIASGSASFLLLKDAGDSLLGRHIAYTMFPVTPREYIGVGEAPDGLINSLPLLHKPKLQSLLPSFLLYGGLPEIITTEDTARKEQLLFSYTNSLLFKDIFEIEGIRHPQVFKKLLQLLALQIGQEISFSELATQLGISRLTVQEYIGLYEKFQIIYTLKSYSTNPRKEISKGMKIYFVDLGIRNAIIDNFSQPTSRTDIGNLFENFIVNLFHFHTTMFRLPYRLWFWRNYAKAEVDLVIENTKTHTLTPIEIKWNKAKAPTRSFQKLYGERAEEGFCVTKDTFVAVV